MKGPANIMGVLLLVIVLLSVPGVFLASRLFPEKGVMERWIWGGVLGLAIAIYLGVVTAQLNLHAFWWVWLAVLTSAAAWHVRAPNRPPLWAKPSRQGVWLAAVVAISTGLRVALTYRQELPGGWDPAFHCLLAQKTWLIGTLPATWEPFEQVPLNYPLGSHALLAVLSRIGDLPVHRVFQPLSIAVAALSAAQIYLLARAFRLNKPAAVCAAAAYALLSPGSIEYHRWGGLPNHLAMVFFIGALTLLGEGKALRRASLIGGCLLAAVALTHHHVMVTAAVLMLAALVYYALFDREAGMHLAIWRSGVWAGVMSGFYMVPYVLRGLMMRDTATLSTADVPIKLSLFGYAFLAFAVVGAVLYARRREQSRERSRFDALLYTTVAALAGLLVLLGLVAPWLSQLLKGYASQPFTPSRFVNDLSYPLSLFAGYGLWRLSRALQALQAIQVMQVMQARGAYACVVIALVLSATNYRVWEGLRRADQSAALAVSPAQRAAFDWIRGHTAFQTVVLNDGPWAPYLTWRRCASTPLPVSEPKTYSTPKAKMVAALREGRCGSSPMPPAVVVGSCRKPQDRVLWRDCSGLAVIQVSPPDQPIDRQARAGGE